MGIYASSITTWDSCAATRLWRGINSTGGKGQAYKHNVMQNVRRKKIKSTSSPKNSLSISVQRWIKQTFFSLFQIVISKECFAGTYHIP